MKPRLEYHRLVRPLRGERVGGDATVVHECENGLFVGIIDVLGHGAEAHAVALLAEKFLAAHHTPDVSQVLEGLHEELRGTRGAAAGLCALEAGSGQVRYAGVGNTVARKVSRSPVRLISRDGVLGDNARIQKEQTLQLEPREVLLLSTDGVSDRFDLEDYPAILRDDIRTVVATVVRRFGKSHDDAACIAARFSR